MSVLSRTVVVPAAATSLQSLVNALSDAPTVQTGGVTTRGITQTFAQLVLQSPTGNAAVIYVGGSTVSATNAAFAIATGTSLTIGSGSERSGWLSNLYVLGNATDKLNLTIVD